MIVMDMEELFTIVKFQLGNDQNCIENSFVLCHAIERNTMPESP